MRRLLITAALLFGVLSQTSCAFIGMTAAGAIGTVIGNITADKIEAKEKDCK